MQTTSLILEQDIILAKGRKSDNFTSLYLLTVRIIPAILVESTVLKRDHWSNYIHYLFIGKLMLTIHYHMASRLRV